jgi:hypothetical protein
LSQKKIIASREQKIVYLGNKNIASQEYISSTWGTRTLHLRNKNIETTEQNMISKGLKLAQRNKFTE